MFSQELGESQSTVAVAQYEDEDEVHEVSRLLDYYSLFYLILYSASNRLLLFILCYVRMHTLPLYNNHIQNSSVTTTIN